MSDSTVAIVVRWRGGDEVERCLHSLLDHGGSALERVILVDSGSGDGGAARLKSLFPDVEVLALEDNRSFGWAANQGAGAAGECSYMLLINPDAEVGPGCVDTLTAFLDDRPAAAGAVPLLVDPDGASQHRWQLRRLPGPWRLAAGLPGAPQVAADVPTTAFPVEQPAAAAWLVRSEVWQALDGLGPAYAPAWWEDVDFCARLARRLGSTGFPAGEGFWLVPEARVVHQGGSSVAELSDGEFLTHYNRNLLRYARQHHPRSAWAIAIGLHMTILVKAVVRPARRAAYLEVLKALGG